MAPRVGAFRVPPQPSYSASIDPLDPDYTLGGLEDDHPGLESDDEITPFTSRFKKASKTSRNGAAADVVFARSDFEDLRATVQQLGSQMSSIADVLRQNLGNAGTVGGGSGGLPVHFDLPTVDSFKKPATNKKPKKPRVSPDIVYSAEVYPHDAPGRIQGQSAKVIKSKFPISARQSRRREKLTKQLEDAYTTGDLPVFDVHKYLSGAKIGRFGPRAVAASGSSSSDSDNSSYDSYRYDDSYNIRYRDDPYDPSGRRTNNILNGSFEIVQDGGTLLHIYSPHVIRAIESVAGSFPGIARDTRSLIVPEPFCALLYFRDELLKGDAIDLASQDAQPTANGDADSDATDSEASDDEEVTREDALIHMKLLYSFLDPHCLSDMLREKSRWQRPTPVCTYEWLWLMFPPGELIYEGGTTDIEMMQAYQVKSFSLEGPFKYDDDDKPIVNTRRLRRRDKMSAGHSIKRLNIRVAYRTHDGRKATLKTKLFVVHPFKGERSITELEIYPAKYLKDPDGTTRKRLIERGRRYQNLASRGQFDYHGDTFSGVRRRLDTRIVVDLETYFYAPKATATRPIDAEDDALYGSRGRPPPLYPEADRSIYDDSASDVGYTRYRRPGRSADRWRGRAPKTFQNTSSNKKLKLVANEELPEEQYLICVPTIQAYILQERLWETLAVASISECVYNERLLDELQISNEARRLVQALSRNYTNKLKNLSSKDGSNQDQQAPWTSDFMPNKGGGQIILLHGKPGVGKTTTAECIAELSHRPLLTITCGDLGTHAYDIQRELERWLHLGTLWNCVLLFDESDVFLESRTHGDIYRNSIVSVFLRAIEYHTGLMFLTTNRIGSFDEAILSRIHAVLHLPNLSIENRREIWDTSFRKLAEERPMIKVDFAVMNYAYNDERIQKLDWNGREIRNAFNTMIALAEWDAQHNDKYTKDGKVLVTRMHLEEVATMSGTFKEYLEELRGMTEDDHMKTQGIRGK